MNSMLSTPIEHIIPEVSNLEIALDDAKFIKLILDYLKNNNPIIHEFQYLISPEFEKDKSLKEELAKPGVYIFDILLPKTLIISDWLKKQWENHVENLCCTPGKNIGHIKTLLDRNKNSDYICLYLGKSETNIFKRIKDHITMKPNSQTYGLKLRHRKIDNNLIFRIRWFTLDKKKLNNKEKLLLFILEYLLHDELKPLLGSK